MIKRSPTNTETLQQNFRTPYRDFFAVCQRVASASHSFLWAGDFAGFYGGLTVVQKLPTRVYVGFEDTFDQKVQITSHYSTYEPAQNNFAARTLDAEIVRSLNTYLTNHFTHVKSFTGVRVHILTELPLSHGIGSNGAIAAALARLLVDTESIAPLFAKAREILKDSQSGHSSGASAYAALAAADTPIVFHANDNTYFAMTLDALSKTSSKVAWPIDFGLIYTGSESNTESVILANDHTVSGLEQTTNDLTTLLENHVELNFKKTYVDMLNMTSGLLINAFVELFRKGSSASRLEHLFNDLNQYQNLLHIIDVAHSTSDLLYAEIHKIASKQINDVGSGAKISGIGKGGVLLFAVPYSTHRTDILALVERLRQETGKTIWLDYASWIDGIDGEPVRIDQDIAKNVHSPFVNRDAMSLTVLNQGTRSVQMLTSEKFQEFIASTDVVLDKTTGKIFIGGDPVTSKELPSQKSAVSIVAALIQTADFTLSNDKLPGTYGTNRYDLQGKIVMPLIKQVKERSGRDLQLSVQGNMYDNYTLSLNPSNIVIGVVEQKN